MKKLNELQLRYFVMFFIFLNFADAKEFTQIMNDILNLISNTFMKAIGGLIIVGICIYAYINRQRLQEIALTCIIFILCTIGITNAKEISEWFF